MDLTGEPTSWLLLGVAFLFAILCGANDGATLLALGVRVSRFPLIWAALLLTAAIIVAPLWFGSEVATTFLDRLVSFGEHLEESVLIGVVGSWLIVSVLARRGLPTSLTVAILGALVGAGVGRGLDVNWQAVSVVVIIALITPVLGFAIAYGLSRIAMMVVIKARLDWLLSRLHFGAFTAQSLAYGVNDGQKMLAVLLVATGTASRESSLNPLYLLAIGGFFALGALLAVRRYANTLVLQVSPIRPANAVAAEFAAAGSVLGTGLLGSPVSMTQTIVTSVIGSSVHEGSRRVRWKTATSIGLAWIYTFPLAMAAGLAISWGINVLS